MKTLKLNLPKVRNMTSNSGNDIPNQFIIETDDSTIFQSYNSIIAVKKQGNGHVQILLDENTWDYSPTTGKYRNQFLGMNKKETQDLINSGSIILCDLNN